MNQGDNNKRASGLRLLPKLLGIAVRTHPMGIAGLVCIALLSALLPAIELWLTQRIMDELAEVMGAGYAKFIAVLP